MNNLDPKTFFFELPIYTPVSIKAENQIDFIKLLSTNEKINYYSPAIGENSTYIRELNPSSQAYYILENGGVNSFILNCVRTSEKVRIYCFFDITNKTYMKIGQYPSIADFHISQIKQYNKVLPKDKLKEFTRAIGLAANGVGIGSFVYLRRIFEGLIEEAHDKAKLEQGWDNEPYSRARMAERIELLKDHLPNFLVENKGLYGILSVGVHALKEEECLAYFEPVKVGIELILDEKLELFEKQKKLADAKQKLVDLQSKIQKPG